ncbi:MAG TPA: sigma-54 dependent transcriptional regulator [Polyangia bacterium]|jgi:DNA-binding NtrC family response regulator|nr:sigma-54 dependent transcriptional regulator [Polyangia bacterium]
MLKVLIVDDQPAVRTALEVLFALHGLETVTATSPEEALDLVASEDLGAVVQDMNFTQHDTTGDSGVALFRAVKQLDGDLPIVILTAWGSFETAVQLVKEGANDYMAKPWDDEKLVRIVRKLLQLRGLQQENIRFRAQGLRMRRTLAARYDLCGLIYASAQMQSVVSLAVTVAASDVPILITGANGAGKEKLAEIIQANSRRQAGPFVKVNAGALPDQLLEAELFGAEAGAFTGATKLRIGRFEAAAGGTLFLDEIGNLSPSGQAKLLRVLQTGEFERLGSSVTRKVDVRIVSATNVDLNRAIADGTFREDLFFRLNVIELQIPPLADRPDDILPLAEHFLATLPGQDKVAAAFRLGEPAREALLQHEWPGNVRELQNRIQRATLVCGGEVITPEHLGLNIGNVSSHQPSRATVAISAAVRGAAASESPTRAPTASSDPADPDRAVVEDALMRAGGIVSKAAAEMGVSRQALYRRMERAGIVLERRPKI